MKDGIYRVTLKIDGKQVVAEGRVRGGVFQGLGELSGIVGVFALDDAADQPSNPSAQDEPIAEHGRIGGVQWTRSDDDALTSTTSSRWQSDAYENADADGAPLCLRRKTDIVSTATDRQRERAIRASLYVPLAWQDLRRFRVRAGEPLEIVAAGWDEAAR